MKTKYIEPELKCEFPGLYYYYSYESNYRCIAMVPYQKPLQYTEEWIRLSVGEEVTIIQ